MTNVTRRTSSAAIRHVLRGLRRQLSDVQKELKLAGLILVVAVLADVPIKAFGLDVPPLGSWRVQVGTGVFGLLAMALGAWASSAPPLSSPLPALIAAAPELPTAYVARHHLLAQLIEAVLDLGTAGQPVAVFGMGGCGKSVLASALVADPNVRTAFPDGVAWVRIGRDCRPAQAQRRVAAVFGSAEQFTDDDPEVGLPALKKLLEGRRCLVIADDLWEMGNFRALNAVKPPGRLLFTTRDREIARGAQAISLEVQELELEQARAVLAGWVKLKLADLPPEADALCLEAGKLALAVAMIGALVYADGGGAQWNEAWEGVLEQLRRHDLREIGHNFDNYEHAKLLRAIQVSIDALDYTDQQRYFDLAVFADQSPVPEKAVRALWEPVGLTPSGVRALIRKLNDRSLLRRDANDWITLHDLQFDVTIHSLAAQRAGIVGAHTQLLAGYQTRLQQFVEYHGERNTPPGQAMGATAGASASTTQLFFSHLTRRLAVTPLGNEPWAIADDRYLLGHLAYHLASAGRYNELEHLLTTFAWLDLGLQVRDLTSLLADYANAPPQENISAVHQALQISAHALAADPRQLAGQLIGRLLDHSDPAIQALTADARNWTRTSWLCPRRQSLAPPGGPLLFTLLHPRRITTVAIAAVGERIVTGSIDGSARTWSMVTGAREHELTGHTEGIGAVAISANGARTITGSDDCTARVWNLISGRCEHELAGHSQSVASVAISADGRRGVTGSFDGTARVWDLTTGVCEHELTGHSDGVGTAAISADGRRAVTRSFDGAARVWDLTSGVCEHELTGYSEDVGAVAISADGTRAITGAANGTARVWDLITGVCEHELTGHGDGVWAVAINADGTLGVTGSFDSTARVWDLSTGDCTHELQNPARVSVVAIDADGARAVTASQDHIARVWDLTTGAREHELTGHSEGVGAVAINADGTRAVTGSDDHTARVWNLAAVPSRHKPMGHTDAVGAIVISADKTRAITASHDGTARVWNLATGDSEHELRYTSSAVWAVAVSTDGTRAITGSVDHAALVWNLVSGRREYELTGHSDGIWAIAISADVRRAVTGSHDGTARVWNLATGACEHQLCNTARVGAVAISADASYAVTGSHDGTARVWNLATGACERELAGHSDIVEAVAISADASYAVTGSHDGTARVWNLATGACERELAGHSDWVGAVAISADGTSAATGSYDHTARVWNLTTGLHVATWTAPAPIRALGATEADLAVLVCGDDAGGVHILEIRSA
jgi:WD40 repeat protein